jgi:hypothetical protein
MTTTAADMGRFLLAVLGDGSVEGGRMLSAASLATMLAPQYTPDPRIPAMAYGFSHIVAHGQRLLYRGGTLGDQAAMVVLAPVDRFGFFVASNSLPGLGDFLFEPLMTHLFGPAVPPPAPTPLADARQRAPRYAGTYRDYKRTHHEMADMRALMPIIQSRVTDGPDGAIEWRGRQWLEIEPLVFRSANSADVIVFRENAQGDITELHAGGATYERIGWWEQTPFHLAILFPCLIAFVAYPLGRAFRTIRRRPASPDGRLARGCAVFVALLNLVFLGGLAATARDLGRSRLSRLRSPFCSLCRSSTS